MNATTIQRLAATLAIGFVLIAPSFPSQAQPRPQPQVSHPQSESDKDKDEKEKKDKRDKQDREDRGERGNGRDGHRDAPPVTAPPPVVAPPPPARERPWQSQPGTAAPGRAQGELARQQDRNQQNRLNEQQRRQRVAEQQRQFEAYRNAQFRREATSRDNAAQLQTQRRLEQARYQLAYDQRLRQQQAVYRNERYDYDADPYSYTPSSHRYRRDGRYYETNQYGADMLRSAMNNGYQEGYNAGRADQADRWRFDYRQSYAYQDANYGYNGRYVRQADYQHYFREGFQRGYNDGYYGRRQFGRRSNGAELLLGGVLTAILNLEDLR